MSSHHLQHLSHKNGRFFLNTLDTIVIVWTMFLYFDSEHILYLLTRCTTWILSFPLSRREECTPQDNRYNTPKYTASHPQTTYTVML